MQSHQIYLIKGLFLQEGSSQIALKAKQVDQIEKQTEGGREGGRMR